MASKPPAIITQNPKDDSSDDHFSSASEGSVHEPRSPIPLTRVERVDAVPAYGEVPGTPSYNKRLADAVPDEIEVIPDGQRSRSGTRSRAMSNLSLSDNANTSNTSAPPVPKTVVERIDDKPAHGEVAGTAAHTKRLADAEPDEVVRVDDINGSSSSSFEVDRAQDAQDLPPNMPGGERKELDPPDSVDVGKQDTIEEQQEPANDFDDFAEEGDDDFGDFDDANVASSIEPEPTTQAETTDPFGHLPAIDLSTGERTRETITAYLDAIFPDDDAESSSQSRELPQPTAFMSERSLSLWQQLVSPPPMQPPNWTRSRIRRLFLVSLGVPVDLDEILPPSKQKRLVLPNINLGSSPRASSVMERLRDSNVNDSGTSIDSKSGAPRPQKTRRAVKGPAPPPEFDLNAAALICNTTVEALSGQDEKELTEHLAMLENLNKKASSVLEYWLIRKDESLKEKEALEGVIENLVGFVKGRRGM